MTRKECLEQAAKCVLQNRQDQYGDVEDCFKKIARLWNAYLPSVVELEPYDVACMMALLKIARIQANPKHGDSWVDLAGYAACGADIAVPEPFRYDKPKAEGGCCQNGNDHSDFKRGDKVQYLPSLAGSSWRDAVFQFSFKEGLSVVKDKEGEFVWVRNCDLRPAPKAEGCEDLVFDEARMRESMPGIVPQDGPSDFDAPQAREALCQHIVDCNPATYGRARKPTGEELAEEDA